MTKRIKQFCNCTPVTVHIYPYEAVRKSSLVAAHVAVYNLIYSTSQGGRSIR